jgi:hypothetical protein
MEAAICKRCQSNNPIFTKFCLICGLEITAEMRRAIAKAPATTSSPVVKQQPVEPEPAVAASAPPPPPQEAAPQKEGSRWLKGLRRLGRS